MTLPKPLPARPSLESLRKQAKKIARERDLTQREALLALAREHGFAGWQELREEVLKRAGKGLEWAALQAERAIHDNDVARLRQLLAEHPALLSWHDDFGRVLLHATTAFAMDVSDPQREAQFYRPDCAALLIDAGAAIEPSVWQGIIGTGASGMLQLFQRKGVLPRTLPVFAALGDLDGVRAHLDEAGVSMPGAFMSACRFKHKEVALVLLDRCIALDVDLDRQIERWEGRAAFVDYLAEHHPAGIGSMPPWRAFVRRQLVETIDEDRLPAFTAWLQGQPWVLSEDCVGFQVDLLEQAAEKNRTAFIEALLDLGPAVLASPPPPPSPALLCAFDYGHAHLVPLLTRIWPLPDDLPHAAGTGDLARVKRWFDEDGRPSLGDLGNHHPANSPAARKNLRWGAATPQQVLDVALAWACINKQFEAATFLLAHGANINTDWSTHEPASILHECALHRNYEAAEFLIAHGIELTLRDYRWNATAEGWAYNAAQDEKMTALLAAAAEAQRV
jgi:hypothetical protein